MRRNRHRLAFVAAGAAVALALAGAAVAALQSRSAPARATTVKVTEREWHIALSTKSLPAGTVTFSVHNAGKVAHAFALGGAGMKTAHTPSIKPGATRTLTVKLAGGTVSIWCPVPGHAALGMKASLTVTGATASTGGAASGGTTTGPDTGGGAAWG